MVFSYNEYGKDAYRAITVTDTILYDAKYRYDIAGRLVRVTEPLQSYDYRELAGFQYDDNGNRESLTCFLNGHDGPTNSPQLAVNYQYNLDNLLWRYTTTTTGATGPTFAFGGTTGPSSNKAAIDGLGRLTGGFDTLTETSGNPIEHTLSFGYDRRSQLTSASISNINSATWSTSYNYSDDGNLSSTTGSNAHTFAYDSDNDQVDDCDLLTKIDTNSITWDKNGRMVAGLNSTSITWNWDHRLREGMIDANNKIECRYSPDGAMAYKESTASGSTTKHKFIVDRIGKIPVVLLVLDADDDDAIVKSYYHALGQTLAQRDGGWNADKYFYLQDRLGSVRQVCHYETTPTPQVKIDHLYTYSPFGEHIETDSAAGAPANPYRFANYVWDSTISQYYCNARWYDPVLARFIGRDPVFGSFREPLTLHAYLYCLNDPVNNYDPTGESLLGAETGGRVLQAAMWYTAAGVALYAGGKIVQKLAEAVATHNMSTNIVISGIERIKNVIRLAHILPILILAAAEAGDADVCPYPIPDDPTQSPGDEWEWRGPIPDGSWYNPGTGEVIRPDKPHGDIGPHHDYKDKKGDWWRVWPDGTMNRK